MSEPHPNQTPNFHRFADWCLYRDSLFTPVRQTVRALLEEAGTYDCYKAQQRLASLNGLSLNYQEIWDLSPLSTLINLAYLELSHNRISDLSPLSNLTNLIYLDLSNNEISDLSPLSGLTNLTELFIWQNQTSLDMYPISTLVNLTLLDLSYTSVFDLSPLSNLTQLTQLRLDYNYYSDDLSSDLILDLSPLSELTNLTYLNIGEYGISDLSPLSYLTNLKELFIRKNRISDLSPLSNLINLTQFSIDDNLIYDLSPLSELTNLMVLDIGNTQICDLSPLSSLNNLIKLRLGNSQISNLSPLSGLTNLQELHFGENHISNLSPLFKLVNLTTLTSHATRLMIDNIWLSSIWQKSYFQFTMPINQQKAASAIKSTYAFLDLEEPDIIYCPDPYIGKTRLDELKSFKKPNLGKSLAYRLYELCQLRGNKLSRGLWDFLYVEIGDGLPLFPEFNTDLDLNLDSDYLTPSELLRLISLVQLLVSKFNYLLDQEEQEALQCLNQLFETCGWIFPYEKVCLVCDRPRKISLDTENRLHAEGEPAIQFSDGWHTGYYYHGVKLPEKYGKVRPHEWQAEWLLTEDNAELRRVLIQAIGYDRICEQLQAQVIDSWQEYTLLRINADVDVEAINLLKMTCPSTGKIHTLRVPPEINSARVAIRWVNWDIDPEDFFVQT